MEPYKSRSGKPSGVVAYESGDDFITVRFSNGETYTYSTRQNDIETIKTMKTLAVDQMGLSTFISQQKPRYDNAGIIKR